jgi:2-oxoglutarate dehydrogenase complex dehydrogenase (E1) component-like enzyme
VLADPELPDPAGVTRVVLSAGKVHYDLAAHRRKASDSSVALLRVEQLYPLPGAQIREALDRYPNAQDVIWVQEEPANMGAWQFMAVNLPEDLGGRTLRRVSRKASASPAVGSAKVHDLEQRELVATAFGD